MPLVDRNDSMLLVIDVQEGFYPGTRTDVDRIGFGHFLDRVAWVVGVAARLRVPIIVTEEDRATNGVTSERVASNLPPGAGVFEKAVFAAPDNPEIRAAIDAIGARTAVLVGLETDVCVSHTALRMQEESTRVVAVGDALSLRRGRAFERSASAVQGRSRADLCEGALLRLGADPGGGPAVPRFES
jgi:nicotinamidase-related amidase